jgi:hypothetical protein
MKSKTMLILFHCFCACYSKHVTACITPTAESIALQAAGFAGDEVRSALKTYGGKAAAVLASLCGALRSTAPSVDLDDAKLASLAVEQRSEELMALAAIYDGSWSSTARRIELPAELGGDEGGEPCSVPTRGCLVVDLTNSPLYPFQPPSALVFRPSGGEELDLVVAAAIQRGLTLEATRLVGEPFLHGASSSDPSGRVSCGWEGTIDQAAK